MISCSLCAQEWSLGGQKQQQMITAPDFLIAANGYLFSDNVSILVYCIHLRLCGGGGNPRLEC